MACCFDCLFKRFCSSNSLEAFSTIRASSSESPSACSSRAGLELSGHEGVPVVAHGASQHRLIILREALQRLGKLCVDGRGALVHATDVGKVVCEQLLLHQLEGQHVAAPTLLHLNVPTPLLLHDHLGVEPFGGIEPLGLQHLQILRHLSLGVVEHLVGIVGIHEGHTLKASEYLLS